MATMGPSRLVAVRMDSLILAHFRHINWLQQVPLNVMEDRLLGSVDVEESVKQVSTRFYQSLFGLGMYQFSVHGVEHPARLDCFNLIAPLP